jgi:hypothetical protein
LLKWLLSFMERRRALAELAALAEVRGGAAFEPSPDIPSLLSLIVSIIIMFTTQASDKIKSGQAP